MRAVRAFSGGMIGALALSAVMGVLGLLGATWRWELLLGSFVTGSVDASAWLLGLGLHLLAGGLLGLVYAAVFEWVLGEANGGIGSAVGAVHAVVSGIGLALIPALHPMVPDPWPAPGVFMLGYGAFGVVTFVALHVVFGAIVGAYYAAEPAPRRIVLRQRLRAFTRS